MHLSLHLYLWLLEESQHIFLLSLQGHIESLRKERDMLKLVESRLNQEKETILSQQQTQNVLLSNLQTIQVHGILTLCSKDVQHNVKPSLLPFLGYTWAVGDRYASAS